MTLVLGALDREIEAIAAGMDLASQSDWNGFPVYRGQISDEPIVLSRSGVGKTQSAMLAQRLIDEDRPSRIIFTGIAGALTPDLAIGDMVIGVQTLQHDMDCTSLGFAPGQIPYSKHHILDADPELVLLAERVVPLRGRAVSGRILTGDQLIGSVEMRERLVNLYGGTAVEMEGASVALVAAINRIPFLLLRTISDHADESVADFETVLSVAAENSWHYLTTIVRDLKELSR